MPRRPPAWRQSLLGFPPDTDEPPAPQAVADPHAEGSHHALQDDRPGTVAAAPRTGEPAHQGGTTSVDAGTLRNGAEIQPRGLEERSVRGPAAERLEPDRQRSDGDRAA